MGLMSSEMNGFSSIPSLRSLHYNHLRPHSIGLLTAKGLITGSLPRKEQVFTSYFAAIYQKMALAWSILRFSKLLTGQLGHP